MSYMYKFAFLFVQKCNKTRKKVDKFNFVSYIFFVVIHICKKKSILFILKNIYNNNHENIPYKTHTPNLQIFRKQEKITCIKSPI